MGEDSKECDFWLPPEFLTDDDVFMGFKSSSKGEGNERKRYFGCDFQNEFSYGFNMFGPQSDLSSPVESVVGSTETESDEEDYLTELTRQMAHSTVENNKVHGLSSSPQSTLCGVLGSKQGSNSESPNSPFLASSPKEVLSRKGTVDLLYAAVEEVARMKKMEEEVGIWAPPRKTSPVYVDPKMSKPNLGLFYSNQPPLSYHQFQMLQFQRLKQQQLMKQRQGVLGHGKDGFWQYQLNQNHQQFTQVTDRNRGDRPSNMAMSAWPTLQQSYHQQKQPPAPSKPHHGSGMRTVVLGNPGPKRECAGTGVFIPRRAGTQAETRKKSGCSTVLLPDRVVQALNLNLQAQVQPRCNNDGVLKYRSNNDNVGDQQWRRRANMYGRETMNPALHQDRHQQNQIEDDDDEDVVATGGGAGDGGGGGGIESMDNPTPHIRYDQHHHSHSHALHNGGAGGSMEAAAMNGVEGVSHNALYCPPSEIGPAAGSGASDQLTLSFQGEVYVFDAVSPEKVQAVLLLLGGYEVPAGIPAVNVAPQSQRASGDFPGRLNQPQRAASLNRFREKRKERCFDKKIRYTVRKEVAMRMQRKKGQFTSAKSLSDEAGSSSADWNEGSGQEEQETSCRHCNISSKSTPMMRRGPAGPRSLCNACGLKWANKGILRDLSKVPAPGAQDQSTKPGEQSNGEPNGSDAMTAAAIITSDGDNPVVTA